MRRERQMKWSKTVKTALHAAYWMRQRVRPPRRSRASWEWQVSQRLPRQVALGGQLEADREHKGEDALDAGCAIAEQLNVLGLGVKIDGDGAVFSRRFGSVAKVAPAVLVSPTP